MRPKLTLVVDQEPVRWADDEFHFQKPFTVEHQKLPPGPPIAPHRSLSWARRTKKPRP